MIHELTVQEFKKVGLLFQPIMVYQPFCGAVLAGIHPGRVFVDDPTRPKTSFMVRPDGWCFLVGELEAEGFKQSLKQALFRKEIIGKGDFTLLLTCQPQEWGEKLVSIFQPVELFLQNRRHYLCHALNYNWRIDLPVDFSVHPMDESLLKRKDLNPPDEIVESIRKWRKLTSSGFRDFGFVIIHEKDERRLKIAGWATIDAVVEGFGDIGFFMMGEYRRRGLATILAVATIEHGLKNGLSTINWTCADYNLGSLRIAEKLGLERQSDYLMYVLSFNRR